MNVLTTLIPVRLSIWYLVVTKHSFCMYIYRLKSETEVRRTAICGKHQVVLVIGITHMLDMTITLPSNNAQLCHSLVPVLSRCDTGGRECDA